VQQIEIDLIHAESPEAAYAGRDGAIARRILRQNLTDQEDVVAPAPDCLANQLLGGPIGIHFRGVDQRHAEFDPGTKRRDLIRPPLWVFCQVPRSLAKDRNAFA
jgi:hypothetical protein